jgi:hypothetical protein
VGRARPTPWAGVSEPDVRPETGQVTAGPGDSRETRAPARVTLWLNRVTSRLNRWLRLIRRPDVTSCHLITSTEDHQIWYSVPISQAPRRKSMPLLGIHSHVKL